MYARMHVGMYDCGYLCIFNAWYTVSEYRVEGLGVGCAGVASTKEGFRYLDHLHKCSSAQSRRTSAPDTTIPQP